MVVYAHYEVVTHLLGKRLAEQPLKRWRQCEVHGCVCVAASGGPYPVIAALCMGAGVLAWEGRRGLHTLPAAMACHLPIARCQLGHVALCKVLWGAEAEARYLGMA